MWSVWSEPVTLYLGQSLALLKLAHQAPVVLQHPATLPLERVLAQLAEAMPPVPKRRWPPRRRLRITLSAALCPAISYQAPAEVRRWQELQQIAHASAAAALGVAPEQLLCEADATRRGLAAALPVPLMENLQRWAGQQQTRITSVRPLWAAATQCAAARAPAVRGVVLHEPDAVTLLADGGQGPFHTSTLLGDTTPEAQQATLRRCLVSWGLTEEQMLKLHFNAQPGTAIPHGPHVWATHWSTP